ncbi:hypothetical protein XarbCFBP8152_06625 [Xanthomonas arboricola]|nr:hypothetical protein XarbCFBP8152_06625 [Xanthomonas arboricola]
MHLRCTCSRWSCAALTWAVAQTNDSNGRSARGFRHEDAAASPILESPASCRCHARQVTAVTGGCRRCGRMLRSTSQQRWSRYRSSP